MESDRVLLIMQIIKDKNKHGRCYVWKANIGPTLNFNEKLNRQSINKKCSTRINKYMISMPSKDKQCIIPRLLLENLCGGEKISTFPKQKSL